MNMLQEIHARRDAAVLMGICGICGKTPDLSTHSEAGKAEYRISGTCEPCFDALFAPEDD